MGPIGLLWPDMEAETVNYLTTALAARPEPVAAGVSVSRKRSKAARQVVVRDDGGPYIGDVRATARIGLTILAGTRDDAVDLAALVVALIGAWPDGRPVVRVSSLSRPMPVADASAVPEMYATAALVVRGTPL